MAFSETDKGRFDLELLLRGSVTLFWQPHVLEDAIGKLQALNYTVMRFRFDAFEPFCSDISIALKWQDQFGYHPWTGNLDAFNDGLHAEPCESGHYTVICIENFDAMFRHDPRWATGVLDIIEWHSRNYLLMGHRLICFVQTNDPRWQCPPLGARHTGWNEAEWSNADRGLG